MLSTLLYYFIRQSTLDISLYERCYLKWSCIASYINIISFLHWSYFILHSCPVFDAGLKFKWKKCLKLMLMYYLFNLLPQRSTSKFSVFSIFQGLLLTSILFASWRKSALCTLLQVKYKCTSCFGFGAMSQSTT